jgi:two-component system phosphate regulon sensor histidine kinase PhoR
MLVIMAMISTVGIAVLQGFWFKSAFDNNEKNFDLAVNAALKSVAEGVLRYNNNPALVSDPVNQLSSDYYVVMVNDRIDANVLQYYIQREFRHNHINQNFEYAVYDCSNQRIVYGAMVNGNLVKNPKINTNLPKWENDNYYFTVYFPHKAKKILSEMSLWLYSTIVVLLVIVFFSYSLLVILKQKRLSEIQRDFINNMTHEIKTPISTISLSAESIKKPGSTDNPQKIFMYATIIQEEANRLKNQVERVLQVARSESKIKLKKEEFNIHEVLSDLALSAQITHKDKNAKISVHFDSKHAKLYGDKLHLSNIFNNLIENAIKYSPNEVVVEISTREKSKGMEIWVKDQGVGIEKQHQRKIFDKFFRVSTGNIHDVKGFGLGLHYVGLMVKAHQGKIRVESTPGKGSTFQVYLPWK